MEDPHSNNRYFLGICWEDSQTNDCEFNKEYSWRTLEPVVGSERNFVFFHKLSCVDSQTNCLEFLNNIFEELSKAITANIFRNKFGVFLVDFCYDA